MVDKEKDEKTKKEETSGDETVLDIIERVGASSLGDDESSFYCLSIIGQIEGHFVLDGSQKTTKYDHLIPLLVSLEESKRIKGILIVLNTMGGDVEAGLAIAEVIASINKPTVSVVIGGGHSIGVPLAVAAKRSFIVPSATMTIHPVRTTGMVISAPQGFDYLIKMQERILSFIERHSNVNKDDFRSLMMRTDQLANDIGSVLEGEEAVKCGLIDRVGGISDALAELRRMTAESENQ